jgi:undecaprenyl-diphosphatase
LPLHYVVILAVVQGITEFLPISSSGHLVVVAALLSPTGTTAGLDVSDVNIVLHAGTLLSILVYYWRRVWHLLGEDRRVIATLAIGTVPAAVLGFTIKLKFEHLLESPVVAGAMLIVTGLVLIAASRVPRGDNTYQQLSYRRSFGIGLAQAVAILPGISRSGSTICAGVAAGLSPRNSATFSFLLAIPVISGATILELKDLIEGVSVTTPISYLAIGAAIAFVVGFLALSWLVRWLEKGRLEYFAYWCIPVGTAVLLWQWFSQTSAPIAHAL